MLVAQTSDCAKSRRAPCFLDFRVAELYCTTKLIGDRIMQCLSAMRLPPQRIRAHCCQVSATLREDAKVGIETARIEGRIWGRRPTLMEQQQAELAKMVRRGDRTAADTARLFNVHPAKVSRILFRSGSADFYKLDDVSAAIREHIGKAGDQ